MANYNKNYIEIRGDYTKLPLLPDFADRLEIRECYNLVEIEGFSSTLKTISLGFCYKLIKLPKLPNGLKNFDCSVNELTSLPKLPNNLEKLNCRWNDLTSLPKLSEGLIELNCDENKLTSLPKLPEGLITLWCACNKLTYLPKLPNTMQIINTYQNMLSLFYQNDLYIGEDQLNKVRKATVLGARVNQLVKLF